MPGRFVSHHGFPSAGPGVLGSDDIERKIATERAGFDSLALALHSVGLQMTLALDHRDAAAVLDAGEALDAACEACHRTYWYPHEVIPRLPDIN